MVAQKPMRTRGINEAIRYVEGPIFFTRAQLVLDNLQIKIPFACKDHSLACFMLTKNPR